MSDCGDLKSLVYFYIISFQIEEIDNYLKILKFFPHKDAKILQYNTGISVFLLIDELKKYLVEFKSSEKYTERVFIYNEYHYTATL